MNEHRVGAHSKREIRSTYLAALRSRPGSLCALVVGVGLIATVVHRMMWGPIAPFLTGAIIASFGWVLHITISDASGLANKRVGVMAEEWTASELNRLDSSWRSRHHVMLQNVDIDHVAVGPGGTLAIDTKFRSNWNGEDLTRLAASAQRGAHDLGPRIGQPRGTVQPVVVMWGPQIEADSILRQVSGVAFVPGARLIEFIESRRHQSDRHSTAESTLELDRYIANRDIGELRDHGPIPRAIPSYFNESFGLCAAVLTPVAAFGLLWPIAPVGLWPVLALGLTALAAFAIRLRHSTGPTARIATAAATTSTALFALIAAAIVSAAL